MSSTHDWDEARRRVLEEGRRRVGPPPEAETVEALLRGELPEAEAARVREVLAYYPELVHIMTAEAPAEGAAVLNDADRHADVARLRQRLGLTAVPVARVSMRRRHSRFLAAAAGIVFVVAIGGVVAVHRSQRESRPLVSKIMIADAERQTRGTSAAAAVVLDPASDYLLKPLHRPARAHRTYRVELLDTTTTPPRLVWKRADVVRQPDGSFPVELSARDLAPGEYELVLYGIDGTAERLATYTIRIEAREP